MFDWLTDFFTSEDAVILGTGLGSIVGGIVIAFKAVKQGKPTSPSLAQAVALANCRIPDLAPEIGRIMKCLAALEHGHKLQEEEAHERDEAAREREDRAEGQREDISRTATEILKLVIRLDERTQGRRG